MSIIDQNETLNDLLINLGRSLLHYVDETWPWTDIDAQQKSQTVAELVARQNAHIAVLSNLLIGSDEAVDFGTYPSEYTDLHYLSLDYLLSQIIVSQTTLVGDIEQTIKLFTGVADDAEVVGALERLLKDQRDIVAQLGKL